MHLLIVIYFRTGNQNQNEEQDLILPSIVSRSAQQSSPSRKISTDSEHKGAKHGKHDKKKSSKLNLNIFNILAKCFAFTLNNFYFFVIEKKKLRKERLLQRRQQTEEDKIFNKKVKEIEKKITQTDICELFPEFRPNKVMNYSLFFSLIRFISTR